MTVLTLQTPWKGLKDCQKSVDHFLTSASLLSEEEGGKKTHFGFRLSKFKQNFGPSSNFHAGRVMKLLYASVSSLQVIVTKKNSSWIFTQVWVYN